jgi:serine protease inhibitor
MEYRTCRCYPPGPNVRRSTRRRVWSRHSEGMASREPRVPFPLLRTSLPVLGLLGAGLALGCGSSMGGQTGDEHTSTLEELKGKAQRLSVSGALPNSASADGWAFAWKFYGVEADPNENTFFSPYSISVASSMLLAGAAGETKSEMQSALSFTGDGDAFHQARNTISQALEARNRAANQDRNAQTLRVVNDLWLDLTFSPRAAFLDTLSGYYGASAYRAPFGANPGKARTAINDKIANDTEQLIKNLLPEGSVDGAALVLTNALYFKARWATPFGSEQTADAAFAAQSGKTVQVPMMRTELVTSYVATDDYVAAVLPYEGNELQLVAIMPTEGSFGRFVDALSAEQVSAITAELEPINLDLHFPKLSIEAEVPLKDRLVELGMRQAFEDGKADFSALSDRPLYISDAFHQATLSIDEEGTVAAAATALIGRDVSAPPPPIPVTFDHPFVFFIRDVQTDAVLFVGHYAEP